MFDPGILSHEHYALAIKIVGVNRIHKPDLIITEHDDVSGVDKPYLYRWHVTPRSYEANDYFHIQVSSDPERPLHDHPWDNMSVLLANAYDELVQVDPPMAQVVLHRRVEGQVVFRKAHTAHRLLLSPHVPYVMTRFFTGSASKQWGFWINGRWYSAKVCTRDIGDGRSVFIYPPGTIKEQAA